MCFFARSNGGEERSDGLLQLWPNCIGRLPWESHHTQGALSLLYLRSIICEQRFSVVSISFKSSSVNFGCVVWSLHERLSCDVVPPRYAGRIEMRVINAAGGWVHVPRGDAGKKQSCRDREAREKGKRRS